MTPAGTIEKGKQKIALPTKVSRAEYPREDLNREALLRNNNVCEI